MPAGCCVSRDAFFDEAAASRSQANAAEAVDTGPITIAPPPAGEGQVVFFRKRSIMGTGQWFNVRERGAALGKLTNGAYFVQITDPGPHTYTAVEEPELKDKLKLEVDPGETYFVEGTLTKGVVIGAADLLTPSDRASFDAAAHDLKMANPPVETLPYVTPAPPSDAGPLPSAAPAAASTAPPAAPAQSEAPLLTLPQTP